MHNKTTKNKKQRTGIVVSNKSNKTAIVSVERKVKVPIYGKYIRLTKKFAAHDEKNQTNIGDTVTITETRPLSKTKRWRITKINNKK